MCIIKWLKKAMQTKIDGRKADFFMLQKVALDTFDLITQICIQTNVF